MRESGDRCPPLPQAHRFSLVLFCRSHVLLRTSRSVRTEKPGVLKIKREEKLETASQLVTEQSAAVPNWTPTRARRRTRAPTQALTCRLFVLMCSHGCEVKQTLFSLSFSFRYQRLQPTPMVSPGKTFTHTACRCKQARTAVPHFLTLSHSAGKQALPLLLSFQGCVKLAAYCAFDIGFICMRSCLSKILSSQ